MDVNAFRAAFPEFGTTPGTGAFTDTRISFWLSVGNLMLTSTRWADLLDHGLALFIAHHLTLDTANQSAALTGGDVGQTTGPLSAAAVDKVSASYSTGEVTLEGAGHWNLSTYGLQFRQLMRMIGAGGIQIIC